MSVARERFQGALMGLALGEAFGLPHVGAAPGSLDRPRELAQPPGRLPLGQYGSGTQTALAVATSLSERGGFDGEDVAERVVALYRDGLIIGRSEADREAVNRLLTGQADWTTSGAPRGRASVGPALRAIPVGLTRCGDPEAAAQDARELARITHKDPRAMAAAMASACAISELVQAESVDPEELTGRLAAVVRPTDPGTAEALQEVGRWATHREDMRALAVAYACLEKGTPRPDTGEGVRGAQVLIAGLVAFFRSGGDFLTCMGTALKAGGETDHTAGLAGALTGAFGGVGVLPRHLADSVSDRGERGRDLILALADRLHALRFAA